MHAHCDLWPPQGLALGLEHLVHDGVDQADGVPKADAVDVQRIGFGLSTHNAPSKSQSLRISSAAACKSGLSLGP